jgi:hypothetical protein
MGGYMGKLAWIDLSANTVKVEEIAEDVRRKYIGGTGLASYILRQFPFNKIDPLGLGILLGSPDRRECSNLRTLCGGGEVSADRNLGRGR